MPNPDGRDLKFKTPEELETKITRYFNDCRVNRIIESGGSLPESEDETELSTHDCHPTVSGLGLAIGLTRQSLINYAERDEFFDTIKKAKTFIESYAEQRLYGNNVAGVIFSLKNNYHWKDKTEVEQSGSLITRIESVIVDPNPPSTDSESV